MKGIRLKNLRINHNLTQKELAEKVNVTPKAISFYELEQREPTNELLTEFAKIFNVTTDYLLGNDASSAENPQTDVFSEEVLVLARGANKLNKKQIQLISKIIEEMNDDEE